MTKKSFNIKYQLVPERSLRSLFCLTKTHPRLYFLLTSKVHILMSVFNLISVCFFEASAL